MKNWPYFSRESRLSWLNFYSNFLLQSVKSFDLHENLKKVKRAWGIKIENINISLDFWIALQVKLSLMFAFFFFFFIFWIILEVLWVEFIICQANIRKLITNIAFRFGCFFIFQMLFTFTWVSLSVRGILVTHVSNWTIKNYVNIREYLNILEGVCTYWLFITTWN